MIRKQQKSYLRLIKYLTNKNYLFRDISFNHRESSFTESVIKGQKTNLQDLMNVIFLFQFRLNNNNNVTEL